jgi:predicted transcriptional regulator
MRTLIGAAAEVDGNNAKTAKTFGCSDRAVANYRKGRTSHSQPVKATARAEVEEVVEKVEKSGEGVKEKAKSRLESLFDGPISKENLATLKPREAISAAKDLATVIDRVSVREHGPEQKVQVVIFAPRQREEKEYEVIDVSARDVS